MAFSAGPGSQGASLSAGDGELGFRLSSRLRKSQVVGGHVKLKRREKVDVCLNKR